jgi:hypothetical protein
LIQERLAFFRAGVLFRSHLSASSELARACHLWLERLPRTLHGSRLRGEMATRVVGARMAHVFAAQNDATQKASSYYLRSLADCAWALLVVEA